jgi:hypothetical protein
MKLHTDTTGMNQVYGCLNGVKNNETHCFDVLTHRDCGRMGCSNGSCSFQGNVGFVDIETGHCGRLSSKRKFHEDIPYVAQIGMLARTSSPLNVRHLFSIGYSKGEKSLGIEQNWYIST